MFNELLKDIQKISQSSPTVTLTGNADLSLPEILHVASKNTTVSIRLDEPAKKRGKKIIQELIKQTRHGIPIYGVSSSYGGQSATLIRNGEATNRVRKSRLLSQAILHVDVSTGDPISEEVVRAAILIRLNMLLPGYSGIRLTTLEKLAQLLNHQITPIVGRYGSVGASGDLAQNGRIVSVLTHQPTAYVTNQKGKKIPASQALTDAKIDKLMLDPKEGLALVNGDNFSSAAALISASQIAQLMFLNTAVSALTIQALLGKMRNFHPLLSNVRPHPGQKFSADLLCQFLTGSQLAKQDLTGNFPHQEGKDTQDPYSIRCLPQYHGPNWERLAHIWQTIKINVNSVSDNPLWTTPEHTVPGEEPYQWVSGGNFLAMHMADALDSLRKIAVHIVKQNDRHLSRLINPKFSLGLPANLSDESAISKCTFKGLQTQMGMFEVYATVLANPVNTAFGVHEENNQDLTSQAPASAIMTQEVTKIAKLALATNLIAACQAIDLRGGPQLLSPTTLFLYTWVRQHVPYIKQEQPLGHYVELVANELLDSQLQQQLIELIIT